MSGYRITAGILFILILAAGTALPQQNIIIGNMQMDQVRWGDRILNVPVDNLRDETAHVEIVLHTVYPSHYLSGLDRLEVDTTVDVPPEASMDINVPFEIPGSFGRMGTRVTVTWQYDNYESPPGSNTVQQVFNNVFLAKDDAAPYGSKKHSVGPVYSMIDHFLLNYEYPRLVLFLLARNDSPAEIADLFDAETDYTFQIIDRFRDAGFFPLANRDLAPGLVALTEREAYQLKEEIDAAVLAFTSWYDDAGRGELFGILDEHEIDPYTRDLPSVQMAILLTLLEDSWTEAAPGFETLHFDHMGQDIEMHNRTRWIVQGGEFFLPKLCLAVFEQNDQMHLATFSPDPDLPFDKASIYDMRKAVEEAGEAITPLDSEQIQAIMATAREKNIVGALDKELRPIIGQARGKLKYCEDYQAPYLADYIIRSAMGKYFVDHKPSQGPDCVRIPF